MFTDQVTSRRLLLTTDNYYVWSLAIKGKLDSIDALDIVLGDEARPVDEEDGKNSDYNKVNRKAYNLILDYIDNDNLNYVAGALSPEDERNGVALWNLLRDRYQANNFVNKTLAFTQFNQIHYEDDIIKFVNEIRTAIQKMKLVGFKSEDESNIIMTLAKLPSQFDYVKKGITLEGKNIDFILKKLEIDHAQDKIPPKDSSSINVQSALFNKIICSHCAKPGHKSTNCFKKHPEKMPAKFKSNENDESCNFITF